MRIEQKRPWDLEATLTWEDLERLYRGGEVGNRYNGESKLLVRMSHPIDPKEYGSLKQSYKQREVAQLDRITMDLSVAVPEGVLRNSLVAASQFGKAQNNISIVPSAGEAYLKDLRLRLVYPFNE
jgi:hypothetical protein